MFVQLTPGLSGLGHECHCGGACCSSKGVAGGVQEYVPNSWQRELAAFSLGGPIRGRRGCGGLGDTSQWIPAAIGIGGFLLLVGFIGKGANRKRKSRALMERVRGH